MYSVLLNNTNVIDKIRNKKTIYKHETTWSEFGAFHQVDLDWCSGGLDTGTRMLSK